QKAVKRQALRGDRQRNRDLDLDVRKKDAKGADKDGGLQQRRAGDNLAKQADGKDKRGELRLIRPDAEKPREPFNGVAGAAKAAAGAGAMPAGDVAKAMGGRAMDAALPKMRNIGRALEKKEAGEMFEALDEVGLAAPAEPLEPFVVR